MAQTQPSSTNIQSESDPADAKAVPTDEGQNSKFPEGPQTVMAATLSQQHRYFCLSPSVLTYRLFSWCSVTVDCIHNLHASVEEIMSLVSNNILYLFSIIENILVSVCNMHI